MATDMAEFVGAAIALNLLFGVPLFVAGLMTGVVAFAILALQQRGHRRFELVIAGLFGVVLLGFLYQALKSARMRAQAAKGFIPHFAGTDSILLAAGIIGATVMPHVIYLHSALTQGRIAVRNDEERQRVMRFQRLDVGIAMTIAGVVNIAMLMRGRGALPQDRAHRRSTRSRAPTAASRTSWATARRWPSGSRCWRRGLPARASARTPGRWSCRASSRARSRCSCAGS